jgi:outer membrane protein OmpA-like peptidoglycan-associated protein
MKANHWLLLLALAPTTASATDGAFTLGLAGGALFTDPLEVLDDTYVVIPRVGYFVEENLMVELDLPFSTGRTRLGDPDPYPYLSMTPRVGITGQLLRNRPAPKVQDKDGNPVEARDPRLGDINPVQLLLSMGIGGWFKKINDDGVLDLPVGTKLDADFLGYAGPGLYFPLDKRERVGLRADARFLLNVGSESFQNRGDTFLSWETTAGVFFKFGGSKDTDGDGIEDEADACVDQAEDADGFEDENGCPDLDNDQDGVPDASDACAMAAEDMDGFEDTDGCAEADNDKDGVMDADDLCRDVAGKASAKGCPDEDEDSVNDAEDECPDEAGSPAAFGCVDADEDRVPDHRDACPTEKAPPRANNLRSDGCPAIVYLADDALVVSETIQFDTGKATIKAESTALLETIFQVLNKYPGIKSVQVLGYTDSEGDDQKNLELSEQRVQAVVAWLVEKGIAPARLQAKGRGEADPIADNATEEGRAANRRVEFKILEQDVPDRTKRRMKGKVEEAPPAP